MPQRDGDSLNRFIFEDTNVRGEVVHLDATWQAVLERHRYPPVVRDLLGEALAAAALLVTTIKSSSSLTLQIQGDGPGTIIIGEVVKLADVISGDPVRAVRSAGGA